MVPNKYTVYSCACNLQWWSVRTNGEVLMGIVMKKNAHWRQNTHFHIHSGVACLKSKICSDLNALRINTMSVGKNKSKDNKNNVFVSFSVFCFLLKDFHKVGL